VKAGEGTEGKERYRKGTGEGNDVGKRGKGNKRAGGQ